MKTEKILTKTFPSYKFIEWLNEFDIEGVSVDTCKKMDKILKEFDKVFTLLRRIYNIVEDEHLNTHNFTIEENIPRNLVDDIFNYLSSKDKKFNEIFIKRQKRYRRRAKQYWKKTKY